jgi:DNA polymerase I-like protein with 3'-5' exonuclease and polymerase domains
MEWLTAVYLSQDKVGIDELAANFDQHGDNQRRLSLPTRLVAKTFLFRLLFGGTAYSYALDPDFSYISNDAGYWQDAIDGFYDKYKGIKQWHDTLMQQAQMTGLISISTGRVWKFTPYLKNGELKFPRTRILNYPVQGLGADLMSLARVSLWRRLNTEGLKSLLISTVHDSILLDCPSSEVDRVVKLCYNVWSDIPKNFEKAFGVPFNLETRVEVQIGPNWKDMTDAHSS